LIVKNNSKTYFFTLLFLLIYPFIQKQWFNLYLFNINNISFYSILYYLSGIICPFLICLNSIKNNTNYQFNNKNFYSKKIITGKALLFLVAINLIFLSYLIVDYIYINFDLTSNLFLEGIKLHQLGIFQSSLIILVCSIFLIFKRSRLLLKKIVLINFMLISFYIWCFQINNINVDDQFNKYRYFGLNDINLINVFILFAIETLYYTWSFLSYNTNLSDWIVHIPQKGNMIPFLKIFIFYFFIIIYYSILV